MPEHTHTRDDETGHFFIKGQCHCGLTLKDPNVAIQLIPGHAANQNFDLTPPSLRECNPHA